MIEVIDTKLSHGYLSRLMIVLSFINLRILTPKLHMNCNTDNDD